MTAELLSLCYSCEWVNTGLSDSLTDKQSNIDINSLNQCVVVFLTASVTHLFQSNFSALISGQTDNFNLNYSVTPSDGEKVQHLEVHEGETCGSLPGEVYLKNRKEKRRFSFRVMFRWDLLNKVFILGFFWGTFNIKWISCFSFILC